LFDGENISFDASLVININSINTPSIMITNRVQETQNLLSLWFVSFLVGLRTYKQPCILRVSQDHRTSDQGLKVIITFLIVLMISSKI